MTAALVNFAAFAGLTVALGAVAMRFLVLGRSGLAATEQAPAARHAARAAMWGATLLLASAVARAYQMATELAGPGEAVMPMARVLLFGTLSGQAMAMQAIWASAAVLAFASASTDRERGWRAAAITVSILAITPGLLGHAAATEPVPVALTAATLHVLAAGAWIGGLFHLWRASAVASEVTLVALIGAFHRVAMVSVALLAFSGLNHVFMLLGSPGNLATTAWGRLYLAKIALVVGALVIGYQHWRHAESRVRAGGRGAVRASLGREVLLAVAVLAVTGLLTVTSPPE